MQILAPCPQCGGEIDFLGDVQVVKCRFCGSLLQVVGSHGVQRYYLEPRVREETVRKTLVQALDLKQQLRIRITASRLVFYPYWWVKGMVFKWILGKKTIPSLMGGIPDTWENVKELKTNLLDYTFPANPKMASVLSSLGIRSGTLKFRPFNLDEIRKWGFPIPVTVPYSEAVGVAEKQAGTALHLENVEVEMERSVLIGERYALIFFPLWFITFSFPQGEGEAVVDGSSLSVLKIEKSGADGLAPDLPEETNPVSEPEVLRFIPFRCPVCGWDLPFRPYNAIHLCTTCARGWQEKDGAYQEVDYQVVGGKTERREDPKYLPFWAFRVALLTSQVRIDVLKAFYQYFPLTRQIGKDDGTRGITFLIPAFRIKDISLLNKSAFLMTRNQPRNQYTEKPVLLRRGRGDVFLNAREAAEMAQILLFSFIPANSRRAKNLVAQAQIKILAQSLEWYPFLEEKGFYFREVSTGLALQTKAVEIYSP